MKVNIRGIVASMGWSQVDRDLDGQIVIYTGLQQGSGDTLEPCTE